MTFTGLKLGLVLVAVVLTPPVVGTTAHRSPPLMLWAWERPEDLRFINPQQVGVASRARTVRLHHESITVHRRLQPLRLPKDVHVVATVRIEHGRTAPRLTDDQLKETVGAVLEAIRDDVAGIQIDFDALE